ncbi:hypothetical protein SAMN05444141_105365 [Pseudovibrio denitrificans]|uniref:Uncharacterized protein n=1 Tax=Pseudovibrio denitrificans TaxID=258256 RepID=A0A1I7CA70_9HYPH|nr:hypothetical protein [Pseudovibrio denitrificans]SFT96288.1 hypothetical protein SAMN05444141_105365 [Pseudovibrio denitrificans]
MGEIKVSNFKQFLDRFGSFDGAVLEKIEYVTSNRQNDYTVSLFFKAVDVSRTTHGTFGPEMYVKITVSGEVEFRFRELSGGVYSVLNDEIIITFDGQKTFINFGAMHSKDWNTVNWTTEETRRSEFYVAGNCACWEVLQEDHFINAGPH